jgi:ABC-2 type transport system permease protein
VNTVDYAELGPPIRGPSALSGDWRRFWHLTFTIARTEFKLRFYGSALGYVWQLVRPLLMFGVLDLVYSLGKLGAIPHYPAMLLSGVVMFNFFTEATAGAVRCVVDRENFVRKIQFPRLAIPFAVILTACFNLGVNFFAVAIFTFVDGVKPRVQWLELPLILITLLIFASGAAMLLSALFVRLRDVQPIWDVVLQVMFYASLILIPIERIQAHNKPILGVDDQSARRRDGAVSTRAARADQGHPQRQGSHPRRHLGGRRDRRLPRAGDTGRPCRVVAGRRLLGLQPFGAAHRREPVSWR